MNTILKMAIFCYCAGAVHSAEPWKLPPPDLLHTGTLMQALSTRRSARTFDSRELPDSILSDLLWAAVGVNRSDGRRTAPSARNWQEMDVLAATASGVYRYNPTDHQLEQISPDDLRSRINAQPFTATAPVCLIYVADTDRMKGAGDEQRTLYSAADTGFISQNVYLFCASRGLHTVVLGSIDRKTISELLNLKDSQKIILAQPVGFPPGSDQEPVSDLPPPRDGTYPGIGLGYVGDIEVEILVRGGKLDAVQILRHQESRPRNAFDVLPGKIAEARGTDGIEAVTGATVTSAGIRDAVEDALSKARAKPETK
ncbi:MAG: nitroreductase family protein [Kiritimatiellia bacterium]|nr:nitroreductase family protein [Kiritimatiellia bacterium]